MDLPNTSQADECPYLVVHPNTWEEEVEFLYPVVHLSTSEEEEVE